MILTWGEQLVMLYNDAFILTLGAKHPRALGGLLGVEFAEVSDDVGPLQRSVLAGGPAVWAEALAVEAFDVAVLDPNMPPGSGLEAAAACRLAGNEPAHHPVDRLGRHDRPGRGRAVPRAHREQGRGRPTRRDRRGHRRARLTRRPT
jgi:hypothetical protein